MFPDLLRSRVSSSNEYSENLCNQVGRDSQDKVNPSTQCTRDCVQSTFAFFALIIIIINTRTITILILIILIILLSSSSHWYTKVYDNSLCPSFVDPSCCWKKLRSRSTLLVLTSLLLNCLCGIYICRWRQQSATKNARRVWSKWFQKSKDRATWWTMVWLGVGVITPWKFNIAPENGWLEDEFPFGIPYFQGLC